MNVDGLTSHEAAARALEWTMELVPAHHLDALKTEAFRLRAADKPRHDCEPTQTQCRRCNNPNGPQCDHGKADKPGEPYAHIVELPSEYSGLTKFFTAPSDPRGFPVYRSPPAADALLRSCLPHVVDDYDLHERIRAYLEGKS